MSAAEERRAYLRATARTALTGDGWTGYAPLDQPPTWHARIRRRWRQTSLYRLLTLPAILRRTRAAYIAELGG